MPPKTPVPDHLLEGPKDKKGRGKEKGSGSSSEKEPPSEEEEKRQTISKIGVIVKDLRFVHPSVLSSVAQD